VLIAGEVPLVPLVLEKVKFEDVQLAIPASSETKIYPLTAPVEILSSSVVILPLTSNLEVGRSVFIPTKSCLSIVSITCKVFVVELETATLLFFKS